MTVRTLLSAAATRMVAAATMHAQTVTSVSFVNGITIPGSTTDMTSGSAFDRRVGFFSDLYYDPNRNEWWAVSDRGPGGGTLPYDTRIQRFTIDIDQNTGRVSAFQVQQTIKFMNGGSPLSGIAPNPSDMLGNAFDPEGIIIDPSTGHLLVSDEYGSSRYEFDRSGTSLGGNTPEKWEGLAIGPTLADGSYFVLAGTNNDYSVTQNASGTQFDVWFDFSKPDPYAASIQCPMSMSVGVLPLLVKSAFTRRNFAPYVTARRCAGKRVVFCAYAMYV